MIFQNRETVFSTHSYFMRWETRLFIEWITLPPTVNAEGRGKRLHGVVVRKGENYGFIQPGDSGTFRDWVGKLNKKLGPFTQLTLQVGCTILKPQQHELVLLKPQIFQILCLRFMVSFPSPIGDKKRWMFRYVAYRCETMLLLLKKTHIFRLKTRYPGNHGWINVHHFPYRWPFGGTEPQPVIECL